MNSPIEVVAGVVAIDVNGVVHFLCGKRSDSMGNGGVWEFPGGKVEEGETNQQALKREFLEEMNAEVKASDEVPFITVLEQNPSGVQYRVNFHYVELQSNSPVDALEHEQLVWIAKEDLKTLPWARTQSPVIEYLMTHKIERVRKV